MKPAVTVEVTISPELRHLRAARARVPSPSLPEPARDQTDVREGLPPSMPSSRIALRRDGAKPVHLRGMPVFDVKDRWPDDTPGFVHQFTLFLDDTGGFHVAARLDPDEGQRLRPSYRCVPLENGLELQIWLERWLRDVLGPALAEHTPYRRRAADQVSAAFHSLTDHYLHSVLPLLERKERCLQ